MNTSTQLKALIRNISKQKSVNAQILLRNYMFERLLERISLSKYKNRFILKGGMLIAAMVGIDSRTTMDMDATIKGILVQKESIESIFKEILRLDIDDGVVMENKGIYDIRDEADYTGFRISINTDFDGIKQILKIDVTTGDSIIPCEIEYKFKLMLEDRTINVMAYNIETVFAEKLETILSRGITNTRMRDFYDCYILNKHQVKNINQETLEKALNKTAENRGTLELLEEKQVIIAEISRSIVLKGLWTRYQKKYEYANDISWDDVICAVKKVLD